jgi:DNA-binding CsgD family transcriptional regulator
MATATTSRTDELERRLANLAIEFRKAERGSAQREAIAFKYGRVFDDLVTTAGHFVEPNFDSLLPDGYMPTQYEARKTQSQSPQSEKQGAQKIAAMVNATDSGSAFITEHELMILQLLAEHRSAEECAQFLGVSRNTFYKQKSELLKRLAFRIVSLPAEVRDILIRDI